MIIFVSIFEIYLCVFRVSIIGKGEYIKYRYLGVGDGWPECHVHAGEDAMCIHPWREGRGCSLSLADGGNDSAGDTR